MHSNNAGSVGVEQGGIGRLVESNPRIRVPHLPRLPEPLHLSLPQYGSLLVRRPRFTRVQTRKRVLRLGERVGQHEQGHPNHLAADLGEGARPQPRHHVPFLFFQEHLPHVPVSREEQPVLRSQQCIAAAGRAPVSGPLHEAGGEVVLCRLVVTVTELLKRLTLLPA